MYNDGGGWALEDRTLSKIWEFIFFLLWQRKKTLRKDRVGTVVIFSSLIFIWAIPHFLARLYLKLFGFKQEQYIALELHVLQLSHCEYLE